MQHYLKMTKSHQQAGVFLLFAIGLWAASITATEVTPADWVVFASATCEECEWLKTDFFPDLEDQVGAPLPVIRFADLDDEKNYDILVRIEDTLGVSGTEVPIFLAGKTMLYGKKKIAAWGRDMGERLATTTIPHTVMPLLRKISSRTYRELLGLPPAAQPGAKTEAGETKKHPDESPSLKKTGATTPEFSRQAGKKGALPYIEVDDYRDADLLFFETTGCKKCARAVRQLAYAAAKTPGIRVFRLVTREPEQKALQFAVTTRLDIPLKTRLVTPTFTTASQALIGKNITDKKLIAMLQSRPRGEPFWKTWDEKRELAEATRQIRRTAGKITLPAVIAAGLIDGINPCAFAVIVFLVSYLTLTGKMGRKFVLIYGFIFAAGVYACYLLIGFGFFQLLDFMQRWKNITRILFAGMGGICLIFAVGAALDTIRAARHGVGKMKFGMPKALHKIVHRLIREDVSKQALGLGAFLVGILVSSIELVCTGQIYLPIIMFINSTARGLKSVLLLVVYNTAFIIPLIVVVFLGAAGVGSEKLAKWGKKHAVATRALTFILVLGLAGIMFYMAKKN
jgi:cytochrome c biogenesis protein CcdA